MWVTAFVFWTLRSCGSQSCIYSRKCLVMDRLDAEFMGLIARHVDRATLPALYRTCRRAREGIVHQRLLATGVMRQSRCTAIRLPRKMRLTDQDLVRGCRPKGTNGIRYARRLIKARSLKLLKWAHTDWSVPLPDDAHALATRVDDDNILEWLGENGRTQDRWSLAEAAHTGNLALLGRMTSAIGKGDAFNMDACVRAASVAGHIGVLEWIHTTIEALDYVAECIQVDAAYANQRSVIKWVIKRFPDCGRSTRACNAAAAYGRLDLLRWMVEEQNYSMGVRICSYAMESNDRNVIEWVHARGAQVDGTALYHACRAGHIDALEWCLGHTQWECWASIGAVKRQHYHIVGWLIDKGHGLDPAVCTHAARHGHLDFARWVHKRGFPITYDTWCAAIGEGYTHVLDWFITLPDMDRYVASEVALVRCAVGAYRLDSLQWLHAHGAPLDTSVFMCALESDSLLLIQWLYEQGCPHDKTISDQFTVDCMADKTLRWLRKHGFSWD